MSGNQKCLRCGVALPANAVGSLCADCSGAETQSAAGAVPGPETPTALASPLPSQTQAPGAARTHERSCFGDYELISQIAHGGMGVVFKARQLSLNRLVAVKMIRGDRLARDEDIKRFRTEAQAAAQLQHPNIVAIHDVGEIGGQHFYSMDYVAGESLAQIARDRPLSPKQAARYVQTIAEAIHFAHQRGILHRDLKPSNVLIDEHGEPRVTDFGLAKLMQGDSELTVSGTIMGSPSYMSPEQADGRSRDVTIRSDVYSLGAILYDLLCGRPPFRAESTMETLRQVLETEPVTPRLLNAQVSKDLETLCLKCLEKDAQRRYGSAQELAGELGRFLRGEPIHARPVSAAERFWRWCKRKPALAASAALVTVIAVGSPIAAFRIERARQLAEHNRALADANLYVADMNLALHAAQSENRARAMMLLKKHVPARGEPDLRGFEWRYLWRQARGDYAFALGIQPDAVRQVLFSPDNQLAISRSIDGSLKLWDLTRRSERFSLAKIVSVAGFSADGSFLLVGTETESVQQVDTRSGRVTTVLTNTGLLVRLTADGKSAVTTSTNYLLRLWDLTTGREQRTIAGVGGGDLNRGPRWALNVVITPDARFAAVLETENPALQRKSVSLVDVQQGRVLKRTPVADETIAALQLSDDGRFLAWGVEGKLHLWEWQTQASPVVVQAHNTTLRMISFSPDGRRLASGASDQFIRLWESSTGKLLDIRKGHQNSVRALAFSTDGRRLLSGGLNEAVRVWDLTRPPELDTVEKVAMGEKKQLPLHQRELAISEGNGWIAAAGPKGAASVYSIATLESAATIANVEKVLQFADDTRLLFAGRAAPDALGLFTWDRHHEDAPALRMRLPAAHSTEGSALAVSRDLRWAAISRGEGQLEIWDSKAGRQMTNFPAHPDTIHTIAFAPGCEMFASCSRDGAIKLWQMPGAIPITTFTSHRDDVFHVAFSPDGQLLASASTDKTVRLWDVGRQQQIAVLEGHRHAVYAVAFAPDGKILASGSIDNTVKLWNIRLQQEVANFSVSDGSEPIPEKGVLMVAFSPDGNTLAARTRDGTLRVWRAATWQQIEAEK